MGSVGTTTKQQSKVEFAWLGAPDTTRTDALLNNELTAMQMLFSVNPHRGEQAYNGNCAQCSAAALLNYEGYDLEAGPRDPKQERGVQTIWDFDFKNYDNYVSPSTPTYWSTFGGDRQNYYDSRSNPNKFPTRVPAVATKIVDTMNNWGTGARAELSLGWKTGGGHSVVVINEKTGPVVYDYQTKRAYRGRDEIQNYLQTANRGKGIKPGETMLVRVDNVPKKAHVDDATFNKMFKKRGGK